MEANVPIEHGDYTNLVKYYVNRAGYSLSVLKSLACYIGAYREGFRFADIGAGTGKLAENLLEIGLCGFAVEPNDAMREEGIRCCCHSTRLIWSKGRAEETGLPHSSVDWVLMGSSFHWVDSELALLEFHRILRPGGALTVLWNPRDLERSDLQKRIEDRIYQIAPEINRVSSGARKYTEDVEQKLMSTDQFHNIVFMEAPHDVVMDKARYLGVWKSVNDMQVQAGNAGFQKILGAIEEEISGLEQIVVPYRTRAWTVQRKGD